MQEWKQIATLMVANPNGCNPNATLEEKKLHWQKNKKKRTKREKLTPIA
jgi:hypothetical protein